MLGQLCAVCRQRAREEAPVSLTLMLMFLYCRMPCSRSSLFLLGALAAAVGGLRGGKARLQVNKITILQSDQLHNHATKLSTGQ